MGFELRIRTTGPWPPTSPTCEELFARLAPLDVRSVDPRPGGYDRKTWEVRLVAGPESMPSMPDAHVQIESDGFYLCENGKPAPGLMEQLVRYALRSGPVTIEEL